MEGIVALVTDLMFHVKVEAAARRAGRVVRFARSVDQAVEWAGEPGTALVVADLNAAGVDAIELARRLKSRPETAQVKLLGFVSHVQEDRRRAALDGGYDRVVARSTFSDKAGELLSL